MSLHEEVSALLRTVAAHVVLPRFRALAGHEIAIKSAGEIVTIADREAELRLHDGLAALGVGARIVGEEAAERDPALLDHVGNGLVWLIDPLDGTANFAAGREPFGMMIALVEDGAPLAGWMLDPLSGRLCHAARGEGATCDGVPVHTRPTGASRPRAALGTHFLAPDRRAQVHARADHDLEIVAVPRCAAESYPRLALGTDDIALFQRILPWDHAAGALFLTEAGGHITHWDRSPYRAGGSGVGVLAAASETQWERAADILLGSVADIELDSQTA
ncbi:inositol monophosphatase family protein [Sphingomonas psychrotolerans]|uniref:Inositol monophosphatase n=1 Tax=Sphingomonas psychrotolerans TaxID=1327635 RepID=A0A2K8MI81_9SPHN|nr:inositol monophosphatase family protein [Sphingomonas psychrotolerans]ATY30881.1 inositol monophosphatase [Sphingomonas psychrotolerans]